MPKIKKIVITSPDVAKVSGLADALVAKILSPKMPRRLSFQSMHPVLSLLGVRLAMIEDPETMSRYTSRLKKRDENCVHSGTVHVLISRRELRKRQRKDGQNSRKYMSAAAARALARHAANSRWAVVKAKKAAQAAAKAARRRAPAQAKAALMAHVAECIAKLSAAGRITGKVADEALEFYKRSKAECSKPQRR